MVRRRNAGSYAQERVTRWFLAYAAHVGASGDGTHAITDLCRRFWPAVFAYLRRTGRSANDAARLADRFMLHLTAGNFLRYIKPEHDRFRPYLLLVVQRFLEEEWLRDCHANGGSSREAQWFDHYSEQELARFENSVADSAEAAFLRCWALIVVERAFKRLDTVAEGSDKKELYYALRPHLTSGVNRRSAELGALWLVSGTSLNLAVHRLRILYGELLRDEVRETLRYEEQLDVEIGELATAIN